MLTKAFLDEQLLDEQLSETVVTVKVKLVNRNNANTQERIYLSPKGLSQPCLRGFLEWSILS